MPPSKSLRPRQRLPGTSSPAQARRKPCRQCNNLDPRGHPSSEYETGLSKEPTTSLALVLDSSNLSKTKAPAEGGCRFCGLLVQALDAFFDGWRGSRQRVNLDLKEKGSIKVGIDGERWNGELIEIYADAGRTSLHFLFPFLCFPFWSPHVSPRHRPWIFHLMFNSSSIGWINLLFILI